MEVDKIKVSITGITPLIIHNGQGANPLNPYAKKMKSLTSKRQKTDEDHEAILGVQWESALYFDETLGLYMPSENLFAALSKAARKHKVGTKMGGICMCQAVGYPILTENHESFEKLRDDKKNKFFKMVVIQKSRTTSCRPIFYNWKLFFDFEFERDIIDVSEIVTMLTTLSSRVGLGVWTPGSPKPGPHGKFLIDSIIHEDSKGKKNEVWRQPS